MTHDVIIVGGGSAGCALANRLSARSGTRVLLIEAGQDTPPNRVPEDILDSYPGRAYLNPAYGWPELRVHLQPVPHNAPERPPARRYEQAKVMGGGSSINGQVAVRGAPADYDAWEAAGAAGWGWEGVLPYFRRLERDMDFDGPLHGREGPIPIRRIFPDQWDGLARAAAEVFRRAGHAYRPDMNGEFADGFAPAPFSNAYGRRVSTAVAYLDAATRQRANLRILAGAEVRRLVVEGRRVVGVEAVTGAGEEVFRAREVIVTAGATHSPALLMRSGIGPAGALRALGVAVVADLPGVGRNLQDHPAVAVSAYLVPEARFDPASRRHIHVHLRYSSGVEGCPPTDMVINTVSRSAWHPLGRQLGSFQVFAAKSFSRGEVTLASADWRREPVVAFNLLSDRRDCDRLMAGIRLVAHFLGQEPLSRCALDPFPSSYSERARTFGRLTFGNAFLTFVAARVMAGPGALRRTFIRAAVSSAMPLERLLADDVALEAHVRDSVTGTWHACGTCRMGDPTGPWTVVDPRGRVGGVEGLRVADASVIPEIPSANTNIPTIMIAEKMADAILSG
ncbi:MAG: GMC family oxidoreductase N-terminal domain-containing protein [Proteobacteria bacterium]|nr:GMC family oxidoreductase N-terminal domain-containing protein [Pseudomonadota bacterium]